MSNSTSPGLNILCGVPMTEACKTLGAVSAPPGRMERVPSSNGLPAVYIDYAHTPGAIDVALRALRQHCSGHLWCVFGCGGDRDVGKRPQMGRVAEKRADDIVITNDNPRSEAPAAIIDDLGLLKPDGWSYQRAASYGHFGRDGFPWEELTKLDELASILEETCQLAGLKAVVFSQWAGMGEMVEERARRADRIVVGVVGDAQSVRAGVVWANTFNKFDPTSPFGGYKESGVGREGGLHGLDAYLKLEK